MSQYADKLCVATLEPKELSDEQLIAEILAGDSSQFERIFIRHRPRVTRVAARFFDRPDRIEEIVQEVFAKAFFALADYSEDRGASFGAWLSRIAINTCYDELRRTRRRPEGYAAALTEDESVALVRLLRPKQADAESALISRDLAHKLLSKLTADDRIVLTLLDCEEMSVSEIAKSLGWGISKVKVRAHRARAALRRVLSEFM